MPEMDEMEKLLSQREYDTELNASINGFIDRVMAEAYEAEDFDEKKIDKIFYKMALLYELHRIADHFEKLMKERGKE